MGYLSDYANNVAAIMQQQGNAQAQARLQQGQAWGNAFQNIGQIVGQIPQQMQQARDMEEQRKLRMAQQANIDSEIRKRDQEAQLKAQTEARNQAVLQIGAGLADLDPAAVQQAIAGVKPEYRQQVENYLSEHAKMKTQQVKAAAQLAQAVGYDPEYVSVLVAMQGPKALEAFNKQTNNGQDAKAIKALVDNYATLGEKKPELKTREVKTLNPDGSETTRIVEDLPGQEFSSAPKPTAPKALQSVQVSVNGRPTMASFDPETGNYFQPGTKEPLAGAMPIPPQGPKDNRIVQVMGPDGVPVWMNESDAVGKPAAQAPRAVTGAERQALSFYNRAKDAVETIVKPDDKGRTLEDKVAKSGFVTQTGLQYLPNFMQSPEMQSYRQAQRAFTEARLRKESGAAIPNSEFENDAKTYFAQPGDDPKTIDQKRQKREKLLEGLGYSAGKAYDEFYGEPIKKSGGKMSAEELIKKYGGGL